MSVIDFPGAGRHHMGTVPRERVIEPSAVAAGLDERLNSLDMLVVIGVTLDGKLYGASTHPDIADTILLLERMKRKLLKQFGDDEFAE